MIGSSGQWPRAGKLRMDRGAIWMEQEEEEDTDKDREHQPR